MDLLGVLRTNAVGFTSFMAAATECHQVFNVIFRLTRPHPSWVDVMNIYSFIATHFTANPGILMGSVSKMPKVDGRMFLHGMVKNGVYLRFARRFYFL